MKKPRFKIITIWCDGEKDPPEVLEVKDSSVKGYDFKAILRTVEGPNRFFAELLFERKKK